jgi:hypothetical protein
MIFQFRAAQLAQGGELDAPAWGQFIIVSVKHSRRPD